MISDIDKKSQNDLMSEFVQKTTHNTLEGEQYLAAILVKTVSNLVEEIKNLKDQINRASNFTNRAISQLTVDLKNGTDNLNNSIGELKQVISDFSNETTKLSNKANTLIWWYVVLTGIIAMTAILSPVITILIQ